MSKLLLLVTFIIREGSGIVMLMQGYEKLTGGFTLKGLVPVIANNTDSPEWYKWFFANIVAHTTSLFDIIVPLGEIAIGLGLIFGVFAYAASFFGAFVMINYILADMIFTYPLQLTFFILLLMSHSLLKQISLKEIINYFRGRKNRGEKIDDLLIVDDEQDIVDICQTYFEYEGYKVTTTTSGKEAISLLSNDIDIMVLDIMMPEVNGYDIVKEMKRQKLDIPFIYLTAKTQEHDTIYALTLGADDYVKKPFSPRELVLRINNLLTRMKKYHHQPVEQLSFDELTLINLSKVVTVNGHEVPMRIKEFELLWYLASRENEVISKSELLEKVWGYDYYEDANTVNVHIHRIREKLEKESFTTYTITTVWGLGYKFERSR